MDLRTPEDTAQALGGPYPASCLYMQTAWVSRHNPEVQKLANALALDAQRARLGRQEAQERLEVAGKSLASAEESLRITRERYTQGAVDITALMASQVALTANQTRQVMARYDLLVARADVERAEGVLGTRWMVDASSRKGDAQ